MNNMGCGFRRMLMRIGHINGSYRDNSIELVQPNGQVVKIKGPKRVKEVLQEYPHHAIYECDDFRRLGRRASPMEATEDLMAGQVYCLDTLSPSDERLGIKNGYKPVKLFSTTHSEIKVVGHVRVKVVVSKGQLAKLLSASKGNAEFIENIMASSFNIMRKPRLHEVHPVPSSRTGLSWRPSLDSIPEK
eukprot:Gb_39648 [translate_table: standard]